VPAESREIRKIPKAGLQYIPVPVNVGITLPVTAGRADLIAQRWCRQEVSLLVYNKTFQGLIFSLKPDLASCSNPASATAEEILEKQYPLSAARKAWL